MILPPKVTKNVVYTHKRIFNLPDFNDSKFKNRTSRKIKDIENNMI